MTPKKKRPKRPKQDGDYTLTVRVNTQENKVMRALALAHTGGSVSEWLRQAAMNYLPERAKRK